ncbi:putative glycerol-3-phosphate dehydrogenase [Lobosporangium transversale]|uniref:Glycerol-3-phosphate dehydrogenase n=1 Tax=Lobosporangium transversale TaxID=64571 RepID=A0A1Y2G945_9FUNG|nr:putative glycerol-3-phosphate dehydrogenase [Lobosporangium transversale]ORY99790.1 putative glycerol-3-phosphate dehydrogenase [Lobosporangium transversale]|eukprot:XP_021876024.1 putative glycerol-3-phosphate dehydrogenase [Lobosporangium transversale]
MWRRIPATGARHATNSSFRRKAVYATAGATSLALASYYYDLKRNRRSFDDDFEYPPHSSMVYLESQQSTRDPTRPHAFWAPPSREEMIRMLQEGPGAIKDIMAAKNKAIAASSSSSPSSQSSTSTSVATKTDASPTAAESDSDVFDLLIIGGGATGAGCAVDAATRGLKVAMVERDDFSSGTSSRSTKLVHGGVRYLEKAVRELDYEQYKLVKEALNERANFLKIAPYLSYQLPIMLPIYKWWQVPYYWAGSKAYDLLAGHQGMESSYFLSRGKALEAFPMLKNEKLVGAMVYYDGQHNDSRMNVALGLTAVQYGAVIANHVEVIELHKDSNKQLCGARVRDTMTGKEFNVKAKGIINATGPFTDGIRQMDDPSIQTIVSPSAGVHIILPNYYSPGTMGLLDPATSDGRVIFFLPWQGNTIAGTTDSATKVTQNPMATEEEINWILGEVKNYLNPDVKVRRGDVLAAWSGIRPLVRDPAAKSTEGLVRNHMINISKSGLLTIAGGKWTTYRAMAAETIDEAIKHFNLKPTRECSTERVKLIGSHGYSKTMFIRLIQQFGLETEIAQHLANSYGDRAWAVASLAQSTGKRWPVFGRRVSPQYPYIEAEIRYAVRREYACTAVDVLARRLRLAFLNVHAALEALPRVVEIMADELKWDQARQLKETEEAKKFLTTMGLPVSPIAYPTNVPDAVIGHPGAIGNVEKREAKGFWGGGKSSGSSVTDSFYSRAQFNPEELAEFHKVFGALDYDGDGHIDGKDLGVILRNLDMDVDAQVLNNIISEVDLDNSGSIEFNEFLEVMGGLKEHASRTAFSNIIVEVEHKRAIDYGIKAKTTDRSGGGA